MSLSSDGISRHFSGTHPEVGLRGAHLGDKVSLSPEAPLLWQ